MANVDPIPWNFQGASGQGPRLWQWVTAHFTVTIIGSHTSHSWEILDRHPSENGNYPVIAHGIGSDFAEAEESVREVVGKSYPASLGYRRFAGPAATTFEIATGERLDFAQFHGQRVLVTVGLGQGRTTVLHGQAAVEHYELLLDTDDQMSYRILPIRIREVRLERGGYQIAASTETPVNRLHRGRVTATCTGVAGFIEGTVEHHGKRCPVHE